MANNTNISSHIESRVREMCNHITQGMRSRGYRAANELRNASQEVLRGQRSGRTYRVPGTGVTYTASAPGEPPAVRTGTFRALWNAKTEVTGSGNGMSVRASIESRTRTDNGSRLLGELLEDGSNRMAPRPYKEKIQQKALPKIKEIYSKPYL